MSPSKFYSNLRVMEKWVLVTKDVVPQAEGGRSTPLKAGGSRLLTAKLLCPCLMPQGNAYAKISSLSDEQEIIEETPPHTAIILLIFMVLQVY